MHVRPEKCLRGRTDCRPYSQIVSDDEASFFCCGENDGNMSEGENPEEDRYTLCFKGEFNDQISCNDKRDLVHNAAVILGALAIIEDEE